MSFLWCWFSKLLPTGEFLVVGTVPRLSTGVRILKVSCKTSGFNLDDQCSLSSLNRLDVAGIPLMATLSKSNKMKLAEAFGIQLDKTSRYWSEQRDGSRAICDTIGYRWTREGERQHSPTWAGLFDILSSLALEEQSQQIKEYLGGVKSLN